MKMTIDMAAHRWVNEFDAIQQGIIKKLMEADPDDWHEVTKPAKGSRVYVYAECGYGEVVGYLHGGYSVRMEKDGAEIRVNEDDYEIEFDYGLPIWGTMWSFHSPCDNEWLETEEGMEAMSRCGFRVFKSEEFGYFFGIDGAGFDFYEACWIPLYKERGLKWHEAA